MAGIEPLLRRLRINTVCYEDNGNYVRALHRYRRAQGSNSDKPKQLFQAFLS